MCLVGEAQRPAERVCTVNIDHNTIYWVRCNQLTQEGISLWKLAANTHSFPYVHSSWCYKMSVIYHEVS